MERKQKQFSIVRKITLIISESVRDFLQKLGEERDEADGKRRNEAKENSRMMEKKINSKEIGNKSS